MACFGRSLAEKTKDMRNTIKKTWTPNSSGLWAIALWALVAAGCGDTPSGATSDSGAGADSVGRVDLAGADLLGLEVPLTDTASAETTPDQGNIGSDAAEIAANGAPVVSFAAPKVATVINLGDELKVQVAVVDADNAAGTATIAITTSAGSAVCAGTVGADNSFSCATSKLPAGKQTLTATATDAAGATGAATLEVSVNTAPGAPTIAIAPAKPTTLDALVATVTADAADPDRKPGELTYTWLWLKDGAATTYTAATLAAGIAKKGEKWTAQATASDPYKAGTPGEASVTIGNAAPTAAELALAPTEVALNSDVTCVLAKAATDADGDALTYAYQWWLSGAKASATGASVAVATLKSAQGAAPKAGDPLGCSAVASDGVVAGPVALSAAATLAAVDVCGSAQNPCNLAAACSNTQTLDVVCTCNPGYVGDGKVCTDSDECKDGTAGCDKNATCTNSAGSFSCACNPGYSGDGKTCSDVDECKDGTAICDLAASCTNTVGSFQCTCNLGYSGDGKVCSDVNECKDGSAGCDLAAACSNTVGSFQCTCNLGYSGDGKTCSDVDECQEGTAGCDSNAGCTNSVGSYKCACNSGYAGNGKACSDIDECTAGTATCDSNATCSNALGSYKCTCNSGYDGDGKVCVDVDECATNNGGCNVNATCTNSVGSSSCACKTYYTGDGKTCSDVDECATNNGGCGATSAWTCKNNIGAVPTCTDIDECKAATPVCDANATCANTVGAFGCTCNKGYSGDGKTCADVDECKVGVPSDLTGNAGLATWTLASSDTKVKWQIVNGQLYYGNPLTNTYDSVSANSGTATSPVITLAPSGNAVAITIKNDVEINLNYDKLLLQVVQGTVVTTLADKTKLPGGSKVAKDFVFSLDAFAGKSIQLRLSFDTIDGETNATSGVLVSKFAVTGQGPACGAAATCSNQPGGFACACNKGWLGNGQLCIKAPEMPGDLVMTEIMYNPDGVVDSAGEWVEIYNPTTVTFDVTGVAFADNTGSFKVANPAGGALLLPPASYLVVASNAEPTANGNVKGALKWAGGTALANTGEALTLTSVDGALLDTVTYKVGASGWPDLVGASLTLEPSLMGSATANDDAASWCAAATPWSGGDKGTPGALNTACNLAKTCSQQPGKPISCVCAAGYTGNGTTCTAMGSTGAPAASCAALLKDFPAAPSKVYTIDPDGAGTIAAFSAHCDMKTNGGGWTLVLKANGATTTFGYDAVLWTNTATLNPDKPDADQSEAKLASYTALGVSEVMLTMVDGGVARNIKFTFTKATSLQAVISGNGVATSLGRDAWKGLMASPSLQAHCNMEGINRICGGGTKVRIGIVSNQENECNSCDSRIGIGGIGSYCGQDTTNSCGNEATCTSDNGNKSTKAWGYVYIR